MFNKGFNVSGFIKDNLKSIGYLFLGFLTIASFAYTDVSNTVLFKASTLFNAKHAPYDGLVYPYASAADWVKLSDSERGMAYNEISSSKKLDPIRYNASELARPLDEIGFSNTDDLKIRNAKITYSVPYLGNYKLDGKENAGSHPGVDIKLPIGTPILAMGNGVVVKAENQEWGFGQHIVVKHNNFPDFYDPNETTTYYSGYAHMSRLDVKIGDILVKGQQIGLSGESGTASTPHLHFQIDKESAPWHPYWPFTATEAKNAGLDFFGGVNAGLGREAARMHTINPVLYIQDNFKPGNTFVADRGNEVINYPAEEVYVPNNGNTVLSPVVDFTAKAEFELRTPEVMLIGKSYDLKLIAPISSSQVASLASESVQVSANLVGDYTAPQYADFSTGELIVNFVPREVGNMNLTVNAGGVSVNSRNIEVRLFSDMSGNDSDLNSVKLLKDKGVVQGFDDGTFRPEETVNKAQAAKLIVAALPQSVIDSASSVELNFKDVSSSDWFYEPVRILAGLGAVDISQEYFNPSKSVNLAEYLKLMFVAMNVDVSPDVKSEYENLFKVNEWYSKYLQIGIERNFIREFDAKVVDSGLKRRNVARIMAEVIKNAN
jgi:murein DD-endopeptidase MepM/ murein hydrolase activator NlpD